jgi:hypothetical protein
MQKAMVHPLQFCFSSISTLCAVVCDLAKLTAREIAGIGNVGKSLFRIRLPICVSSPPIADQARAKEVFDFTKPKSFVVMTAIGMDLPILHSIFRISGETSDSVLATCNGLIVPS